MPKNVYQTIIDEMIEQQNTETNEQKIENTRIRNMRMAGIINDYLLQVSGQQIIITGGLSVEFYTDGNYTTQDIDLITAAEKELNHVLSNLGFHKVGKYWEHDQLELVLELVANIPYDGIYKEPTEAITEDGFKILFNNVNDILMDRIRGFLHWNFQQYGQWIYQLIKYHKDELDFEYLKENLHDEEWVVFNQFIDITEKKFNGTTLSFYLKQILDKDQIVYSESKNDEIQYFTLSLTDSAKKELGPYFGLLLSPYLSLMLYNEEEDEMEVVESNKQGQLLTTLVEKYGKPFLQIQEFLKEWIE